MTRLFITTLLTLCGLVGAGLSQAPIYLDSTTNPNQISIASRTAAVIALDDTDADGVRDFAIQKGGGQWEIRSGADGSFRLLIGPTSVSGNLLNTPAVGINDINGDGAGDLVSVNGSFLQARSGATGALLWNSNFPPAMAVGSATPFPTLARIVDVNGDGIDDVAIGIRIEFAASGAGATTPPAPLATATVLPSQVRVISGLNGLLIATMPSPVGAVPGDHRVASAGDMNGDGFGDILIQTNTVSGTSVGTQITVHHGLTGAQLLTVPLPSWPYVGNIAGGQDMDGDTIPDFCYGDATHNGRGVIHAFSGAGGAIIRSVYGDFGDLFGAFPTLGDHDGDGLADVAALTGGFLGTMRAVSIATGNVLQDTSVLPALVQGGTLIDVDNDGDDDLVGVGLGSTLGGTSQPSVIGAVAGRRSLGPAAEGNTSFPFVEEDLLRVSGSEGGNFRSVEIDVGTPLDFEIRPLPVTGGAFDYAIFAYLGAANPADAVWVSSTVGMMAFTPAALYPAGVPVLLTLATSVPGLAGTVVATPPGPQIIGVPAGIPVALDLTIQAVVIEPGQVLRKTNGILISVR